ncbi:kinesin-like protein KIF28 [Liolophura sinensis]|uniref:kinesin-like protein KIF28 n=1 Tax=Liolophura sinensis TaxID=3198878 RepID=UPI0031597506
MPSSDSVKVAVRVRPFSQREKTAGSKCIISMNKGTTVIKNPQNGDTKVFSFDHSYWSHDSYHENEAGVLVPSSAQSSYADQKRVFNDVGKGVLDNAWQGYNAALFAYGQTGSGKSYSMIGYGPNKGIVPITCGELFKAIEDNKDQKKQLQVSFSMLEIYNEQIKDLLSTDRCPQAGGLKIRQSPSSGFYVEGLKHVPVKNYEQIEKLMEQGTVKRTTASTNMNATSSRSHMVITVKFNQVFENEFGESTTKSSEINLVDLAGSERADSTGATGDRLKEGSAINQSLSTLGNVISALADLAMGKKKVLVPYRDSALTKLLQSALGGNSRTIMIAALSPADINYDETLSTLRYADRAKKIQNKAVINESPTDRLIRELKEENARLMKMLGQDQQASTGADNHDELQRMLEENENKMRDMELSWEQRLEAARRDWEKTAGKEEGKSWQKSPHITNVNEDPMLSNVVKLCFTTKTCTIGRIGSPGLDIELRGFGIQPKHTVVTMEKSAMFIQPCGPDCLVVVNGVTVKKRTKLNHLDRLKLGSNNLFLFVGFPSERRRNDPQYDYTFMQTELAESEGVRPNLDPELRNDTRGDAQMSLVFQDYVSLLPQIAEANGISEELNKKLHFSLEIKSFTSHDPKGRDKRKDVIVRVMNTKTKLVWIWSREKFVNRKNLIDEMYLNYLDGENISLDKLKDPFWDPIDDIFLGSCHIWLQSLSYHLDTDEHLSLHNYRGKEEAVVHVKIMPCTQDGKNNVDENAVLEPHDLLEKPLHFKVTLSRVMGVRWVEQVNSRGVYLRANIPGSDEHLKTTTIWGNHMAELGYNKRFTIKKVTEEFLNVLKTDALVLELWGTQFETSDQKSTAPCSANMNGYVNGYHGRSSGKEKGLEEVLEENRILRGENFKLKQSLEHMRQAAQFQRRRQSTSSIGEDDDDSRPMPPRAPRRMTSGSNSRSSSSPVSNHHHSSQQPSSTFDVELAKGLRDFFREIKDVQERLINLREGNNIGVKKSTDKNALRAEVSRYHDNIKATEEHLAVTVLSLKEVVTNTIRKSQLQKH